MSASSRTLLLDRRQALRGGLALGAGLVLGFRFTPKVAARTGGASGPAILDAFLRIAPDDTVTILSKHLEMGQGSYTGVATILADELDADWSKVRVEAAPSNPELYKNFAFGVQGTGGSTAMANSWMQLRQAGAKARAMLVAAAAQLWGAPASEISVAKGIVSHDSSGHSATFGELAEAAAEQAPPENPALKKPEQFKLIGKDHLMRVDVAGKSNGTASFTMDVVRPGMLTALIERAPRFGGQVRSFDASEALKVPGVVDVLQVPSGVAVFAKGFWPARQGRAKLKVEWDESAAEKRGSDEILAEYRGQLGKPGLSARSDGDFASAIASADRIFEADFEFPYLAHAPMEPLDAVIELRGERCEMWAGSQLQTVDHGVIAAVIGLPFEKIQIHTQLAGGSFGRRATPDGDIAFEAASLVAAWRKKNPGQDISVKLIWPREDDIRGGKYRPIYVHRLRAGIDQGGKINAWHHQIIGQSIAKGSPFEAALVQNGIDTSSVEGAATLPYDIPNLNVELTTTDVKVPVLWWRSVGHTHNAYSTETFLDDIARETKQDPVALRRQLLSGHPRHAGVLDAVVKLSKWGRAPAKGRARGLAVHESFGSFVAMVAEISEGAGGSPKVEKVYCAVDCGIALNPDVIRAQMEGGVGFGLSAALYNAIHLDGGRVRESNFNDYRSMRLREMPHVETAIVASAEAPTGVGEPGVPPIAPAVANAWATLTGESVRRLPFKQAEEA